MIIINCYFTVEVLLTKPVLDLNMTVVNPHLREIYTVAPLPDGGAFVSNHVSCNDAGCIDQVSRVNVTGHVTQLVYQCVGCSITGLLVLNNNLYVILMHGTLVQINIDNTNTVQVYQVPDVKKMVNSGPLSYHPSVFTYPDLLLLVDMGESMGEGNVFSYNVTSKSKQVHLTGLYYPSSVSFMTYNSRIYYVVCELLRHQVRVYTSTWGWYKTLHGAESGDGQLYFPRSAIGLPDGSIIISEVNYSRIWLFTIRGRFVRHLLTWSDGLKQPKAMSISLPYIWFTNDLLNAQGYRLYRYKLY